MNDNAVKLFCSVGEIAALAGVSKRTVWRDVERGVCSRPIHIGAQACWSLHAAMPWIAMRRRPANGKPLMPIPKSTWSDRALPEFVTYEELAHLVGSSERTTRGLVASGDFPRPIEKPGRPRLWRTTEVVAWLQALERTEDRIS
jgi:predicted DNA-binding transcriptional regulator AlpA